MAAFLAPRNVRFVEKNQIRHLGNADAEAMVAPLLDF